jgi:surface carbohydrate biosynthesis protein
MRLALVVDSPKRDLDGMALVAYQLARRGVEAVLVPMYQQGYDLPLLAPEAVLVNYARENNRDLLAGYRALGMRVIVLDTEGGVLSESALDAPPNWAAEMRRSGLAACVDEYLFWGPALREAFVAGSGMPAASLHLTGCPRYDFCAEPWRRLLEFPERDFILVNTNFSAINPRFTSSSEDEKAIFLQLGWPRDYVERLFAELAGVFPRYLDALERLARALPGARLRVRPHPFEDEETYWRRFGRAANVTVDGSGSALPAIASAACVVHLNCGTAVESLMLGTPAVSLEFLNSETMRSHAALPSKLSLPAGSERELVAMLAEPARLKERQDARRERLLAEHLEPWFHRLDGRAAERVVAIAIAAAGGKAASRSIRASLRGGRAPSAGRLLAGVASQLIGSKAVGRLQGLRLPARRAKAFTRAEVERRIEALARLESRKDRIAVAQARHPLSGAPLASIRVLAQ